MSRVIVKIGLVAVDATGRLLVVRKRGGRTYLLPGGKPEGDESDLACLMRECREELGIDVVGAPRLLVAVDAPAADLPDATVRLRAYLAETHGDPIPMAEIEEMRWVDVDNPGVGLATSIADGVVAALRADRDR